MGEAERRYIRSGHDAMIGPLQTFLEGEMKNITRERKILENKRLDLDSCKSKVRKARAMQVQPQVRKNSGSSLSPSDSFPIAEGRRRSKGHP